MRPISYATLLLLAVMCLARPAGAQETEIHGRVLDQDGKPAVGVRLALRWMFQGDKPTPQWQLRTKSGSQTLQVVSDSEGQFTGKVDPLFLPTGVYAIDEEMKTGAFFVVSRENAGKEFLVTLKPLVRVHGKFKDDLPELPLSSSYVYVTLPGVRMGVANDLSREPAFSVLLPPGKYNLRFSGTDRKYLRKTVTLRDDQKEYDFGTLTIPAKAIARMYGKEPPELTVTDARGAGKDVRISDFKGKWLLIEFWGFW